MTRNSKVNIGGRLVIERLQYLNDNDSMRVEIEELDSLLGPEDSEVDLRQLLRYARRKKGGRIFESFSTKVTVCSRLPAECDGTSVKG